MMEKVGLTPPVITEELVKKWVDYLVQEGHVKPPQSAEKLGVFVVSTAAPANP